MTILVSVETVLLVLLVLLVAGLLRSHAEILRRLGPPEEDAGAAPGVRVSSVPGRVVPPAPDRVPDHAPAITGDTPHGDAVSLSFEGAGAAPTLLAFLSTGCTVCAEFWQSLGEREIGYGIRPVAVVHGPEREQPARLRKLTTPRLPVVMSSQAWEAYGVPGAPYFVLVDGAIRGEGAAGSFDALASLVGDSIEDAGAGRSSPDRRDVDATLAAAGIGPDHPSLFPAGRSRA